MSTSSQSSGRDRLVACAFDMLREGDPADVSIREVSRRAGVASGTPYHHFGDRDGLLAACARVGWEELAAALADVDDALDADAQMAAIARAYLGFAFANPGLYRLMMSAGAGNAIHAQDIVVVRSEAMGQVTRRLAGRGDDAAALKARGTALWSLAHGYAMLRLAGAVTGDADEQVESIAAAMVRLA